MYLFITYVKIFVRMKGKGGKILEVHLVVNKKNTVIFLYLVVYGICQTFKICNLFYDFSF